MNVRNTFFEFSQPFLKNFVKIGKLSLYTCKHLRKFVYQSAVTPHVVWITSGNNLAIDATGEVQFFLSFGNSKILAKGSTMGTNDFQIMVTWEDSWRIQLHVQFFSIELQKLSTDHFTYFFLFLRIETHPTPPFGIRLPWSFKLSNYLIEVHYLDKDVGLVMRRKWLDGERNKCENGKWKM